MYTLWSRKGRIDAAMKVFFNKQCFQNRKIRLLDVAYGFLLSTVSASLSVNAAPQGGEVVAGQGSITTPSSTVTQIQQQSNNLVLDWQSFNVDANELVQFSQPSSTSAVLNRINDISPSQIFGSIEANGLLFLMNPNGVIFGEGSRVQANGLFATNLEVDASRFMTGDYYLESLGMMDGSIINRGILSASTGGVSLISDTGVVNEGKILATAGSINLAVANYATLDFDGDGILQFTVSGDVIENAQSLDSAILNSGEIIAEGGDVLLSGQVARDVFTNVVNNSGVIKATRVVNEGGVITLAGPSGNISNSGTLDVSGVEAGDVVVNAENITHTGSIDASASEGNGGSVTLQSSADTFLQGQSVITAQADNGTGGVVHVLGNRVGLFDQSSINASGLTGGGEVLVGGDFQGKNADIQNASQTYVGANTSISADALKKGDGGKVIVWADDTTQAYGSISATGGVISGNGGFVETSGKVYLDVTNTPDVTAANGDGGLWLIDPNNLIIVSTVDEQININGAHPFLTTDDTASLGVNLIKTALNGGASVTVTTGTDGTNLELGNLTIQAGADLDYNGQGHATLTLTASNNIDISATISDSDTGDANDSLTLVLDAGNDIDINAAVSTRSGNVSLTAGNDVFFDAAVDTGGGDLTVVSAGNDVNFNVAPVMSGGAILVTSAGNDININNDILITTGNSSVSLTAVNDIKVDGEIDAGTNTISVITTGGVTSDIYSVDATDFLDAASVIVNSAGTIGQTATANADADALYTDISAGSGTLTLTSCDTCDITVVDPSDYAISNLVITDLLNAGERTIDLTANLWTIDAPLNIGDDVLALRSSTAAGDIAGNGTATNILTAAELILESLVIDDTADIGYVGSTSNTVYMSTPVFTAITGGALNINNAVEFTDLTLVLDPSTSNDNPYAIAVGGNQSINIEDDNNNGVRFTFADTSPGAVNITIHNTSSNAAHADIEVRDADINVGTGTVSLISDSGEIKRQANASITAGSLQLSAAGNITVVSDVSSIAAVSSGNGNINISNLDIDATAGAGGTGALDITTIAPDALGNSISGISTNDGTITIASTGTITVSEDINNTAANDISIISSAGDIEGVAGVNGVISTANTAANVVLNANGGIGLVNAVKTSANILGLTTAGADAAGNITVVNSGDLSTADITVTTNGSNTATRTVDLTALSWEVDGAFVIAGTATDLDLNLTSTETAADPTTKPHGIFNAAGSGADTITISGVLTLTSATGIGTSLAGVTAVSAIEVGATGLILDTTTGVGADGDIHVDATGSALILGGVSTHATGQNISITAGSIDLAASFGDANDTIALTAATGDIFASAGAITADSLALDAAGGIGIGGAINAAANSISLDTGGAGSAGNVFFVTTGASYDVFTFSGAVTTAGTGQLVDLTADSWTSSAPTDLSGNSVILRATTVGGIAITDKLTADEIGFSVTGSAGTIDAIVDAVSVAAITENGGGDSGSIVINGTSAGTTTVVVDSVGSIDGLTTTNADITLTTTDESIDIQQDISAGTGSINLTTIETVSANYDIGGPGVLSTDGGIITIDADGAININTVIDDLNGDGTGANGELSLTSGGSAGSGDITVVDTGVLSAIDLSTLSTVGDGQTIDLTSGSGWNVTSDIGTTNDLTTLTATTGDIDTGAFRVTANDLTLEAIAGGIGDSVNAVLTNAGSLTLSSTGVGAAGDIYVTDSATPTLNGVTTHLNTDRVTVGTTDHEQTVELSAVGWEINGDSGDINDTVAITATGGDILHTSATGKVYAKALALAAQGVTGGIGAIGSAVLTNAGLLTLSSAGNTVTEGDIYVEDSAATSTLGVVTTDAATAQIVDLKGATGWDLTASNVGGTGDEATTFGDTITVTATTGNIDSSGGTIAANNVTLTAAGGIGIGGPVNATATTALSLNTGGAGSLGDVYFATTGSLDISLFSGVVSTAGTGQLIDLTAGSWTSTTATDLSNNSIILRADTGGISIGALNTLKADEIGFSVTNSNDTINVSVDADRVAAITDNGGGDSGSITINGVSTGTGTVVIGSVGSIDGLITTNADITVTTVDEHLDIQQDISAGTGAIGLSATDSAATGDYNITGNGGVINTTGLLTLQADGGINNLNIDLQATGTINVASHGGGVLGNVTLNDVSAMSVSRIVGLTTTGSAIQTIDWSADSWNVDGSLNSSTDNLSLTATNGSVNFVNGSSVLSGGDLTIRADDMEFATGSTVTGANINLYTQTASAGFLLGDNTDSADQVELAAAELQVLSSTGIVTIGENGVNTGDIILGGMVDLGGYGLSLTLATEGNIDSTNAGHRLTTDNALILDAANGTIGFSNTFSTGSTDLSASADGDIDIDNEGNLASFDLTSANGALTLNNTGSINITGNVSATAIDITATNLNLGAGFSVIASAGDVSLVVGDGELVLNNNTITATGGNVNLAANRMVFDFGTASVITGTDISIATGTSTRGIVLGSSSTGLLDPASNISTESLHFNAAELAMLNASGTVIIGGGVYEGNIDVGANALTVSSNLTIETTGSIDDSTGGNALNVGANLLTLNAGMGIGNTNAITFTADSISADNTTLGSLALAPTGTITLGGGGNTINQQVVGGTLSVNSGGDIVIAGDVTVSGGGASTVDLDATGTITRTDGTVIAETINLGQAGTTTSIGESGPPTDKPVLLDGKFLNIDSTGDVLAEGVGAAATQLAGTTGNITFLQSGAGDLALGNMTSGVLLVTTSSSDINGVSDLTVVDANDITVVSAGSIGVTQTLFIDAATSLDLTTNGVGADGNIIVGSNTVIPFSGLTTTNGTAATLIGLEAPSFTINSALGEPLANPALGNLYLYATTGSIDLQASAELNFINLYLGAAGGITQNVASVIQADNLLIGTNNSVDLSGANDVNTLAANVATAGQSFTFNDIDGLELDAIVGEGKLADTAGISTSNGAINLTTGGALTQSALGVVSGSVLTTNTDGGADLSAAVNAVAFFDGTDTTGNILLVDSGTLEITGISTTGNISLTAGSLSQTGIIAGNLLSTATAGGSSLDLSNTVSSYNGTDSANGNILLVDNGTLDITGISTGGNISLTAGSLTGSGILSGNQLTTTTTGGSVLNSLNTVNIYTASNTTSGNIELNNDAATLTLAGIDQSGSGDVIISNTGNIVTSAAIISNGINLTAGGTITQSSTGTLTGGLLTTQSVGGTTLGLNNLLTSFNGTDTTGNILLVDSGTLDITGISTTGNISLTAGSLTDSGTLSGSLLTTQTAGSSTLNSAGNSLNSYNGSDSANGDIVLVDTGTLNITGINTGGNVSLTAGSLTDSGVISGGQLTTSTVNGSVLDNTHTVSSYSATNSTSGDIVLNDNVSTLTLAGINQSGTGNVTITNTGDIVNAAATASNAINLTAGGTITQTAAFTGSVLTAQSSGGTTLDNAGNNLTGFSGTDLSGGNILIVDTGALDIAGISTSGNVSLTAGSLTDSGVISGGQLTTSTVNGSVLDNTHTVNSYSATNSTSGDIVLNDNVVTLTLDGINQSGTGNVTITNTGDIVNAAATASNAINLTAGGTITQTAAFTGSVLTAQSSGGTTLDNTGNNLTGFSGTDLSGGDILIVDTGALDIAGISTSGNVSLTAGSLTNSGPILGNALVTATSSGSILDHASNAINAYTANSTAGDIVLANTAVLDLGAVSTVGNITVSSTGNIDQSDDIASTGGGDISVTSSGSISMINGLNTTTTGGTITYQASGDLALSLLDAADGTSANVGTVSVISNNGNIVSTDFFNASVRADTVNVTATIGNIGQDELNAFVLSSDIQGKVTLEYAGNAYITTSPNINVTLDIVDIGSGLINSGAARSAGTQRSQSSGLEDVGFIDLALFSDINLFVIDGLGIALPADQSDEAPLPGSVPVMDDEEEKKPSGLHVSVFSH